MNELKESLKKHISDICKGSQFFNPEEYNMNGISMPALKTYIKYSRLRLGVVQSEFEEMGYKTRKQIFKLDYGKDLFEPEFKSLSGCNAVFSKGKADGKMIMITGHNDYCAALGADDNASGLAVMLEIADYFKDSKLCKNLVFATFDLEEMDAEGSLYYVDNSSRNSLDKIKYLINLDALGAKDLILTKSLQGFESDKGLMEKIYDKAESLGYKLIIEEFNHNMSDFMNFACEGVKSIDITSMDYEEFLKNGGTSIEYGKGIGLDGRIAHTVRDVPENVNLDNLSIITRVLIPFLEDELD